MAKRRAAPQRTPVGRRSKGAGSSRATGLVFAFVLGGLAALGAGYLYLHSRHAASPLQPVAEVADRAVSRLPSAPPGHAGAAHPSEPLTPPFGSSEDVFEAGARTYAAGCASCHGAPARTASGAAARSSPQLFGEAAASTAAQSPAQLYRAIATGAPNRGMPGYGGSLSDHAIWQLVLLLRSAGQPLPDPVTALLNR